MVKIKGFLDEELPQEKIEKKGPQSLTKTELLAICLRTGTKEKNVIELSKEIIDYFNDRNLLRISYDELLHFKGISKVKAAQIVAIFELSRRIFETSSNKRVQVSCSEDIFNYAKTDFSNLTIEKVMVVFVDSKNNIIKKEFVHEGSINYSIIEPRKIIKRALTLDASGIFLLHNHPSGDPTPSQEDKNITKKIKEVSKMLGIKFLDHIIVGDTYYSFFDNE
jgi:DNA repair protein RadC